MQKRKSQRYFAFTLTQVAIVVGILAALGGMLLPVAARVRCASRQTACQSNLKQIALAVQQYVQDHDGRFPNDRWNTQVFPYIRTTSFVRCPTRRFLALEREEVEGNNLTFFPDYLYNTAKLSRIHHTAKGNVWFDGEHEAAVVNVAATLMHADDPFEFYTVRGNSSCGVRLLASTLHSGGANYSFVDGHVKWLSPNGISRLQCE